MFRFAFSIIKNEDDAEDIVSDVMIKIWAMGSKLAYVNNLQVYLFKAVKNKAIDYSQANNKNNTKKLTEEDDIQNLAADNVEEKLLFSELSQKIEIAINALPPQCQKVFRLIKEEGLSYKDVSAVLEISQNTIETHMRIALKQVKLALDEYLVCQ